MPLVKITARFTAEPKFEIELGAEWGERSERTQRGEAIRRALAQKIDLRGSDLRDSNLSDSNLSGSDLRGSDLRGSNLSDSNLRGSNLSDSDLRGSDLRGSDLRDSNLSGSDLRDSNLRESNLSGSNLSDSNLSGSDLRGSNLRDSNLSGSDLRGSSLSSSDLRGLPVIPKIHQAVYAAASQPGALDMDIWHKCETTHCRAGWVIHLTGAAGHAMEWCLGTPAAAALIYLRSDPAIEKIPDFYASNEDALEDMRRLANLEIGK